MFYGKMAELDKRLEIQLAGVRLSSLFIAASGPLTARVKHLEKIRDRGGGAASTKIAIPNPDRHMKPRYCFIKGERIGEDRHRWTVIHREDKRLSLDEAVRLVKQGQDVLPLFVNFCWGSDFDGWKHATEDFQQAGAAFLELNFCCPNRRLEGTGRSISTIGADTDLCVSIIEAVKEGSNVPIFYKITPNNLDMLNLIVSCYQAGARGVHVVGNPNFAVPPIDNEGLPVIPNLENGPIYPGAINGAPCLMSGYSRVAQIAQIKASKKLSDLEIIGSGGIFTADDAKQYIMYGASAISACTALMRNPRFGVIAEINKGLLAIMEDQGHAGLNAIGGKALKHLGAPSG